MERAVHRTGGRRRWKRKSEAIAVLDWNEPDLTLAQLQSGLTASWWRVRCSQVAIWRWLKRRTGLTKKSLHAQERDTQPTIERRREFLKIIERIDMTG